MRSEACSSAKTFWQYVRSAISRPPTSRVFAPRLLVESRPKLQQIFSPASANVDLPAPRRSDRSRRMPEGECGCRRCVEWLPQARQQALDLQDRSCAGVDWAFDSKSRITAQSAPALSEGKSDLQDARPYALETRTASTAAAASTLRDVALPPSSWTRYSARNITDTLASTLRGQAAQRAHGAEPGERFEEAGFGIAVLRSFHQRICNSFGRIVREG